jgi:hypothetical protein
MTPSTPEPTDLTAAREAKLVAGAVDATEVHSDPITNNVYVVAGKKGAVHLAEPVVVRISFKNFVQFASVFLQQLAAKLG